MNNVEIYGAYNYTEEIAKLYGKVDCKYSVYDTNISNVSISLSNRLYEAYICSVAVIDAKNTELGNIVKNESLGVVVEDRNIQDLIQEIEESKNKSSKSKEYIQYKIFYDKWKYDKVNRTLKEVYMNLY